jgi:hypothetical protein
MPPEPGTRTFVPTDAVCPGITASGGVYVVLDSSKFVSLATSAIPSTIFRGPMRIAIALAVLALIPNRSLCAPQCSATGKEEIAFRCDYAAIPRAPSETLSGARIVLNRAMLLFSANDESHLVIRLTFTNAGRTRIVEHRGVYLVFDDDAGANYLRRALPAMDLTQLAPGKRITFSQELLSPAFRPGRYRIAISVPSVESPLQFDPTQNFLFSSAGVPDLSNGLNTLGTFTVLAGDRSRHKP